MNSRNNGSVGGIFPAGSVLNEKLGSYDDLCQIATHWKLNLIQLAKGGYKGRMRALHTAQMQVAVAHHGCGTRFLGEVPPGTLVLCFTLNDTGRVRFRGEELHAGQLAIHDSRNGIDFLFHSAIDVVSVAVNREMLLSRAATFWQCEPNISFSVLSTAVGGLDPRMGRAIHRQMQRALAEPAVLTDAVQSARLENELLDQILSRVAEPKAPENTMARRWIARRAAAILEERFREDIGIADLCTAVRASRRTLHLGFLEVYGFSPMHYLRLLRLNAARHEIRTSSDTCVSQIASHCGFSHFGRFSAAYQSHFGVLPSVERLSGRTGR